MVNPQEGETPALINTVIYKRDQKSQVRGFSWVLRDFDSHSLTCFIQSKFGSQETNAWKVKAGSEV